MPLALRTVRRALTLACIALGCVAALASATDAAATPLWRAPLQPFTVTRVFAPPPTPYAAGHRGVDVAGVPGERVTSAGAGTVSFAGQLAGRGVVVVTHGVLRTTYEPVEPSVRRGGTVREGQLIGLLNAGHSGCPVRACLHWGLLRGDVYLDPLSLLSPPAVRLLPPAGLGPPTVAPATGSGTGTGSTLSSAPISLPMSLPGSLNGSMPSPTTWSLVALAGAGTVVGFRRR